MFGFGKKTWENNEEWFKETCVNLNVVYYGWIMWCTYLFQEGNPRKIGSLKELYDDVLINPESILEVFSRGRGIGYDRQIKTAAILAKHKLNWLNKNKPTPYTIKGIDILTKSNLNLMDKTWYEDFRRRQLPFMEIITKLIIKYDEFSEVCSMSEILSKREVDQPAIKFNDIRKLHSDCINYLKTFDGSELFNDFEIIKKTANKYDKLAKFNW